MEGRDEGQVPDFCHLLSQKGRDRVWNGVMNVKQVEFLPVRNLPHSRSKCQRVGRVVKERVVGNFYFVIKDSGRSHLQTNGRGVADEMHLMTPVREFEPQLGG